MSYRLGVDLGTTFTAAAVCDVDTAVANPEVIALGAHTAAVPSVVFVAEDGSFVFGDSAGRRCVTDPDQVIREFKRRIGDPIPIVVNGSLYEPHSVAARFVRWVVDQVAERKGSPPDSITVTHPAAWGEYKRSLFVEALRAEDLVDVELMTEPEAASIAYAADLKVDPGSTVAVYDLGGGTFDAAVVRGRDRGRFERLGAPEGLEALGGADFDELIFESVRAQLVEAWEQLDVSDPAVLTAVAALRRECTDAKEALSSDTEVTIPVMLPGVHSRVRVTRGEFEELIAPAIGETLESLRRCMSSAGVAADDLEAVLLVGGSSRIPIIAQQLSEQFGRPVVADADPKSTVALGAALSGLAERAAFGSVGATRVDLGPVAAPGFAHPAEDDSEVPASVARKRRTLVLVAAVLLALFAGAGSLAFEPFGALMSGGARAAGGLPGVVDERAAGVPVDGDRAVSAAVPGSGENAPPGIDPWTGRPVEKDGTTTPGPQREGATPTESTPSVTDLGPRPPVTAAGGSQSGGSQSGGSENGGSQGGVQDRTREARTDPTKRDTGSGGTESQNPSTGTEPPASDPPAEDPGSSTPQDPSSSPTVPPTSSESSAPAPDPTTQSPAPSETSSGSAGGSEEPAPSSSQPASSVSSESSAGTASPTSGTGV